MEDAAARKRGSVYALLLSILFGLVCGSRE